MAFPRVYLVSPPRPAAFLDAALRGGVDILQLRAKDAGDAEVLEAARTFRAAADRHDATFILNDRADLALRAGADGVHVGQDDGTVAAAREALGPGKVVGRSTHTPQQVDAAAEEGPDYIACGPVHETPTKPGRPGVGLDLIRYAAANARMPWFAIGGLGAGNLAPVVAAGAERVVVVRALTGAADPEQAARDLRAALEAPVGTA